MSQESIDALEQADDQRWTPAEAVALRYAEQVTRDARRVGDDIWAELRQHFDAGEIIELTAATTLFNMFNRFNDALQVDITQPGWPGDTLAPAEAP